MRLVYLAHPCGASTAEEHRANLERAKRWLAWCVREHPSLAFTAPWIQYCEVLDDARPAERERGMAMDQVILQRCDAIWFVGGRMTEGMLRERTLAAEHKIAVRSLVDLGAEPPSGSSWRLPPAA